MKEKKATFSQRFIAFILDILIVGIASTIITAVIPVSDAANKLYTEQNNVAENYVNGKTTMKEYANNMMDLSYDISKETGVVTIVSIVISLLYFVVYPTYKDGQTLGKKILKIKIVKNNDTDLSMNDLLLRACLNTSIFINIISVCLVFFTNKQIYIPTSSFISVIAFSQQKEGLHDKIAHTDVVMTNTVKEEEVCEN